MTTVNNTISYIFQLFNDIQLLHSPVHSIEYNILKNIINKNHSNIVFNFIIENNIIIKKILYIKARASCC